jgi:hypothetical protein
MCQCYVADTLESADPYYKFVRMTPRKLQRLLPEIYRLLDLCLQGTYDDNQDILNTVNHLKVLGMELSLIHRSSGNVLSVLSEWYSEKIHFFLQTLPILHAEHIRGSHHISGFEYNIHLA